MFSRWLFIGPMQLISRVGRELSRPQLMFETAAFALRGSSPNYCPTQVLMAEYYGQFYTSQHLSYGVSLWAEMVGRKQTLPECSF